MDSGNLYSFKIIFPFIFELSRKLYSKYPPRSKLLMLAFFRSIWIFSSEIEPFHPFTDRFVNDSLDIILSSFKSITKFSFALTMPPSMKKLYDRVESSLGKMTLPSIFNFSISMGICLMPKTALLEGFSFSFKDGVIWAFETDSSFSFIFPKIKGSIFILASMRGNIIRVPLLLFNKTSLEETLVNKWPEKTLLFNDHPLL